MRFHKASFQGHAYAQNNLAFRYKNGEGVAKDLKEAVRINVRGRLALQRDNQPAVVRLRQSPQGFAAADGKGRHQAGEQKALAQRKNRQRVRQIVRDVESERGVEFNLHPQGTSTSKRTVNALFLCVCLLLPSCLLLRCSLG